MNQTAAKLGDDGPSLSAAVLAATQIGVPFLWIGAAVIPPTVWRVPDAVFETGFPTVFAVLVAVGLWTVIRKRDRTSALIVGTGLCAAFLAVTVALTVLVPTSLPDF